MFGAQVPNAEVKIYYFHNPGGGLIALKMESWDRCVHLYLEKNVDLINNTIIMGRIQLDGSLRFIIKVH